MTRRSRAARAAVAWLALTRRSRAARATVAWLALTRRSRAARAAVAWLALTRRSRAARAAVAWLALVFSGVAAARPLGTAARGRALFNGKEPLAGRVRDHRSPLPAQVVVCRNCHAAQAGAGQPPPAPAVDRALLLQAVPRRGGPPSAYDRAAFCKLLRTGVDPAYVLVAREMPVFELDDAQCDSLWLYLTAERPGR